MVNEFYKKQLTAPWAQSLVPKTCQTSVLRVWSRIRFGKLRPTSYWCFSCPDKEHGSGTGDRWHGGKGGQYERPLTPLERFLNPSSPGRIGSQFSMEESQV